MRKSTSLCVETTTFLSLFFIGTCRFKFKLTSRDQSETENTRANRINITRRRNTGNRHNQPSSDVVYSVEGNVEFEYVDGNEVGSGASPRIEEAVDQQPIYEDDLTYINREFRTEAEMEDNPGQDGGEFHVVEAVEEESVYDYAVENPKSENKPSRTNEKKSRLESERHSS